MAAYNDQFDAIIMENEDRTFDVVIQLKDTLFFKSSEKKTVWSVEEGFKTQNQAFSYIIHQKVVHDRQVYILESLEGWYEALPKGYYLYKGQMV